jgi:hypothetical protein
MRHAEDRGGLDLADQVVRHGEESYQFSMSLKSIATTIRIAHHNA